MVFVWMLLMLALGIIIGAFIERTSKAEADRVERDMEQLRARFNHPTAYKRDERNDNE